MQHLAERICDQEWWQHALVEAKEEAEAEAKRVVGEKCEEVKQI